MALTHGMNIEEVRALGDQLQQKQSQIQQLISQIESRVNSAGWEGPDANRFKHEWWPQHRTNLQKIGEELRGFGTSALNNASEQEGVSNR